jgi:hypothetical protein
MARLLIILSVVGAAFWVYSIVDCALQPATRHRGVPKSAWIAIVLLLPVLGGILWFVIGRGGRASAAARRAPDDDPDFLGRLDARAVADQDERIRRLEAELAELDSEADDPRTYPAAGEARGASGAAPGGTDAAPEPPSGDGDDDARGQRGAVG